MRELEQRLEELEGRYSELSTSYESLQVEHSGVKLELNRLRKEKSHPDSGSGSSSPREFGGEQHANVKIWGEKVEIMNPLLFDVTAFCFDGQEGRGGHAKV